jgi:hypothetical protein
MRFAGLLLSALLVTIGTDVACAGRLYFGVRGGLGLPIDELKHEIGPGPLFGISLEDSVDQHFRFEVGGDYLYLGEKRNVQSVFGFPVTIRERAQVAEGTLNVRAIVAPPSAPVRPYIKAGVGFAYLHGDGSIESGGSVLPFSDSHLWTAIRAGAGLEIPLSHTADLCVEGLFHEIETDPKAGRLFTVSIGIVSSVQGKSHYQHGRRSLSD